MKTLFVVLFLSSFAVACPRGTVEYKGSCYADPAPKDTVPVPEVKPSQEKPPSDKMPSYQREGVVAATPPSLVSEDEKLNQEKAQAEAQGKKAAGVPAQVGE